MRGDMPWTQLDVEIFARCVVDLYNDEVKPSDIGVVSNRED